jgi:phosphoglucomutase
MDTGKRVFNVAAAEQSAGMSIFGGVPKSERDLGEGGHVRDKDGTFASLLLTELAAYAKDKGLNLLEIMNQMYLDPTIGMFVNYYEADPMDGAYPGLRGDTHKQEVLMAAIKLHEDVQDGKEVTLGGMPIKSSVAFWTGKYDKANWDGFPDEGLRFYFDDEKMSSFILRPSGTANAIRLHVLLQEKGELNEQNVNERHAELLKKAKKVVDDVREKIGASRDYV